MNQKSVFRIAPLVAALGILVSAAFNDAQAAGIISNGTVALGVQDSGTLNVNSSSTIFGPSFTSPGSGTVGGTGIRGLFVNGTSGFEATFPGCLCEGWGVAVASLGITGFDGNGFANLAGPPGGFGTDANGNGIATTVRTIANGSGTPVLEVTHSFHPTSKTPYLYQVDVTMKNLSGANLGVGATDLRYTRLMDFDTEPTAFSEFVTIQAHPATNVLYTDDNGFQPANPLAPRFPLGCSVSANFTDCGPADHGALFDLGFPALLGVDDLTTSDNDTMRIFSIYYGAAPTEALADAARAAVGAGVYAYGQTNTSGGPASGTPITYIFGFGGVGAPEPIPEPATLALLSLGLVGLGLSRRKGISRL